MARGQAAPILERTCETLTQASRFSTAVRYSDLHVKVKHTRSDSSRARQRQGLEREFGRRASQPIRARARPGDNSAMARPGDNRARAHAAPALAVTRQPKPARKAATLQPATARPKVARGLAEATARPVDATATARKILAISCNGFEASAVIGCMEVKQGRKRTRKGADGTREAIAAVCTTGDARPAYANNLCHACYMRSYRASKRAALAAGPEVVFNVLPFPDSHFEATSKAREVAHYLRELG